MYSKAGEQFDPTKKGGRFKPEFIWQTNWQEQLKRQEDLERQQREYRQRQRQGGITGGTGPGEQQLACANWCWAGLPFDAGARLH